MLGRVGRPSLRCRGGSWRGVSVEDGRCPRMHVEAQARRSSNARRLMLRAAVVAGVVGAALVAPRISIHVAGATGRIVARSLLPGRRTKRGRRPRSRRRRPSPGFPGKAAPRRAWVRASEDGSEWTPWTELLVDADHGPDPGTAEAAGRGRPASRSTSARRTGCSTGWRSRAGEGRRSRRDRRAPTRRAGARRTRGPRDTADRRRVGGGVTRRSDLHIQRGMGAESCQPADPSAPEYINRVRVMFVHHTATANGYTEAEAPEVIRSVCAYHVFSLGWHDIAYNFLIDRLATPTRAAPAGHPGDLRRPQRVQPTRAGWRSSASTSSAPSPAALESLEHLLAWSSI